MKKTLCTALVWAFTLCIFVACSKSDNEDDKAGKQVTLSNLPTEVSSFVTNEILTEMIEAGMTIHPGTTPPNIQGTYLAEPFMLAYTNVPDVQYTEGLVIAGYQYKFYDQQGTKVKTDYENKAPNNHDVATGLGTFISGADNKFSVFIDVSGESESTKSILKHKITYKHIAVLSGELTAEGIKDFKYAFYAVSKTNDLLNEFIPNGGMRIWIDKDFISKKTN